jgi:hypothetical protein
VQDEAVKKRKGRNRLDSTLGNWNSRAFVASFLPRARLHMIGVRGCTVGASRIGGIMGSNIFYIIGVIVVVLVVLSYLGLR